jgi:hypothetical protein
MRHVTEVQLVGAESLEHIESLRWYEAKSPSSPDTGALQQSPRQEMYNFVHGKGEAFALNSAKTHYAMLEDVNGAHVQYVKTKPDTTKSDNLLSLPRY